MSLHTTDKMLVDTLMPQEFLSNCVRVCECADTVYVLGQRDLCFKLNLSSSVVVEKFHSGLNGNSPLSSNAAHAQNPSFGLLRGH